MVIALIGIVNTLMLSVFERTREIGLLRAVGMQRGQVRAMIRSESVIIALFGAVVDVVVGTGLGLALASALRHYGVTSVALPGSFSASDPRAAGPWIPRRQDSDQAIAPELEAIASCRRSTPMRRFWPRQRRGRNGFPEPPIGCQRAIPRLGVAVGAIGKAEGIREQSGTLRYIATLRSLRSR